jgi:hypothetical protein
MKMIVALTFAFATLCYANLSLLASPLDPKLANLLCSTDQLKDDYFVQIGRGKEEPRMCFHWWSRLSFLRILCEQL